MATHTLIILQARTGSTRLPNKVLTPIQGIPLLTHCIRRLKQVAKTANVIVATSTLPKDNEIVKLAQGEKVDCFRGSEKNALDRFLEASKKYSGNFIIRATADNPLVDISEARRLIKVITSGRWDYVSMIEKVGRNKLPEGVGLEAFSQSALKKSWEKGREPHHREHVNEYILENQTKFKTKFLACLPENNCPELRLTIDTPEDMAFINSMLDEIGKPAINLTTNEIIAWWNTKK